MRKHPSNPDRGRPLFTAAITSTQVTDPSNDDSLQVDSRLLRVDVTSRSEDTPGRAISAAIISHFNRPHDAVMAVAGALANVTAAIQSAGVDPVLSELLRKASSPMLDVMNYIREGGASSPFSEDDEELEDELEGVLREIEDTDEEEEDDEP